MHVALLVGIVGALTLAASTAYASTDPVQANPNNGSHFNRYVYADNNPYKYIDPDGRDVVFGFYGGASLMDGVQTMSYLMQSKTFRSELGQLQTSKETYKMSFDRSAGADMSYDHNSRTINVDPSSGLRVGAKGDIQSAALGAGHEVSHAAEHDRIGTAKFSENLVAPFIGAKKDGSISFRTSPEEKRATSVEGKMAKELGEPSRANYTDSKGTIKTCGPVSRSGC